MALEHAAPLAGDAVIAVPPDRGVPIDIVWIVRADLPRLMAEFVEEGKVRIARLHILFKRELGEAGEIAEAFRADERIIGHVIGKDNLARFGQFGAEGGPALGGVAHTETQSPPFTSSAAPVTSLA
jgi:hypothetical protein